MIGLIPIRLALSGALIGVALAGLIQVNDAVGGIIGFAVTLFAKYRDIF